MSENKLTDQSVSQIDAALAAAQGRKAAKVAKGESATTPKAPKAPKSPSAPKRPRLTDEEKAARVAARDATRAANKVAREEKRAAKMAERAANKPAAHLKKVNRAAEKLVQMNEALTLTFNEVTANFTAAQIATLASHLSHFNRVKATERALNTKIEAGQSVTIIGGDPKFIGRTGVVTKAQRIRAYVSVEGINKPIYVFTSDCEINVEQASATA